MAKKYSLWFGVIFLLIGLLGFIPNPLVGSGALFHTDSVHNLIHLIVGLILLYTGTKAGDKAVAALKTIGVVYLVVAVLGFLGGDSVLGIFEVNAADNWLHVVLGVLILWLGLKAGKGGAAGSMPSGVGGTTM